MSQKNDEIILAFNAGIFDTIDTFNGESLKTLAKNTVLMNRDFLEGTDEYRQAITYPVLCKVVQGELRVALYRRPSKNSALPGRFSVGFGGHVEIIDTDLTEQQLVGNVHGVSEIIAAATRRELEEETGLSIVSDYNTLRNTVALIIHNGDDIGRRHVGFLSVFVLDSDMRQELLEDGLMLVGLLGKAEIEKFFNDNPGYELEEWSRLALGYVFSEQTSLLPIVTVSYN